MSSRRRSTTLLTAAGLGLASLFLLTACQLPWDSTADPSPQAVVTQTVTAAPPTTPTPVAASTPTPTPTPLDVASPTPAPTAFADEAAMESDISDAVRVVNGYWGTNWSTYFSSPYKPPTVVGLYDGTVDTVYCGDQLLGPDNAQYCPVDNSVDWDSTFMQQGYESIGKYWVYLIVAHEWGHAVVEQNSALTWDDPELQADCLAGAALYGAATDGLIAYGPGATKEFATGLSLIGDDASWSQPTDHGDSLQRVGFFGNGRDYGVNECLTTGD